VFGGKQDDRRHFGEVIAKDLNEDDVIELTCKCLSFYSLNAQEGETAADFLERIGVDNIRKACE
jgi:NAD(P)H-nitrite reductase large subunit